MTPAQLSAYQKSIAAALAANPDVARYGGTNSTDAIANAYLTGDWSSVTSLTGKPFSKEMQQEAVSQAERALNPAYRAQEAFDRDEVTQSLASDQQGFDAFQKSEAEDFGNAKDNQDQNAADQGILFSGARVQKLNDLRNTYQDRESAQRNTLQNNMRTTARDYQYKYGNQAARGLRDFYQAPGQSSFNPNVAGGKVTAGGMSSLYNTGNYNFQGTAPVSQKAAVQTRAASLLSNRANKLSSTGYKTQY